MPVSILSLISMVKLLLHHPKNLRLLPLFFVFIQSEFTSKSGEWATKTGFIRFQDQPRVKPEALQNFGGLGTSAHAWWVTLHLEPKWKLEIRCAFSLQRISGFILCFLLMGSSEAHISALGVRSGCSAPSRILLESMVWIKPGWEFKKKTPAKDLLEPAQDCVTLPSWQGPPLWADHTAHCFFLWP